MATRSSDVFRPGCVRKTANTDVPDDAPDYVSDLQLLFYADAANEYWCIHAMLQVQGPFEDGLQIRLGNVTGNGRLNVILYDVSADAIKHIVSSADPSVGVVLVTDVDLSGDFVVVEATVESNAAGNVQFQYAKTADDQEPAIVLQDSFMMAFRVE